ncbi:MAG: arsenate reductase ArsC, partial [Gemmobacter sp.]
PAGQVNPYTLEMLQRWDMDTSNLRSKSWDEFAAPGAPQMDFVFTVCDQAAGEVCPVWPGHPVQAHWGIPDPAGHGSDGALADFEIAYQRLAARIDALLALDEDALEPRAWRDAVIEIGKICEGAS